MVTKTLHTRYECHLAFPVVENRTISINLWIHISPRWGLVGGLTVFYKHFALLGLLILHIEIFSLSKLCVYYRQKCNYYQL